MNFGFEKPNGKKDNDVSEKNQRELGDFKISPEGKILYREPGEDLEIKTAKEFIDVLTKEIKDKVGEKLPQDRKEEFIFFINYPEKFRENFERTAEGTSEDKVLDSIDNAMRDLSSLYDAFADMYEVALDLRTNYKDVSDEKINREIKKGLDERIHFIQKYKKNTLELEDFLQTKKVEYILKGEQNGTISMEDDQG
jgi:hypothetical protein